MPFCRQCLLDIALFSAFGHYLSFSVWFCVFFYSSSLAITCTCTGDYIAILTGSRIPIDVISPFTLFIRCFCCCCCCCCCYYLYTFVPFLCCLFVLALFLLLSHLPLIWNSLFLWNAQLFQFFFLIIFVILSMLPYILVILLSLLCSDSFSFYSFRISFIFTLNVDNFQFLSQKVEPAQKSSHRFSM